VLTAATAVDTAPPPLSHVNLQSTNCCCRT